MYITSTYKYTVNNDKRSLIMKKLPYITTLFLKYKNEATSNNYKTLYDEILQYAYKIPILLSKRNEEHSGDFVLYIQPKVANIIKNFQYYGSSLEGYLYRTFKAQFYSYIKKNNMSEEKITWYHQNINYRVLNIPTYVQEDQPLYKHNTNTHNHICQALQYMIKAFPKRKKYQFSIFCQRMWIYVIKNSVFISDDLIYALASQLHITHKECSHTLNIIYNKREIQKTRYLKHKEQCEQLYSNYIKQTQYLYAKETVLNIEQKHSLQQKINLLKLRYRNKYNIFKHMNFCLSNQVLSGIFDISKGSIDSAMFHLKKSFNSFQNRIQI